MSQKTLRASGWAVKGRTVTRMTQREATRPLSLRGRFRWVRPREPRSSGGQITKRSSSIEYTSVVSVVKSQRGARGLLESVSQSVSMPWVAGLPAFFTKQRRHYSMRGLLERIRKSFTQHCAGTSPSRGRHSRRCSSRSTLKRPQHPHSDITACELSVYVSAQKKRALGYNYTSLSRRSHDECSCSVVFLSLELRDIIGLFSFPPFSMPFSRAVDVTLSQVNQIYICNCTKIL
jgi:hypothetical protein